MLKGTFVGFGRRVSILAINLAQLMCCVGKVSHRDEGIITLG